MKNNLPFVKMHGAGNDFIMIDGRDLDSADLTSKQIADLCHRRKGIGADGLIIIGVPNLPDVDFRMVYFNSDGGEAEMCGNGARCCVAFAHHLSLIKKSCRFETWHGALSGQVMDDSTIEVSLPSWFDLDLDLNLPVTEWPDYYFVNTGVPHLVIPVDNVDSIDVHKWGTRLRYLEQFAPAGTNVNWVSFDESNDQFKIRTYERGVEAETLACGTGASACAVVLCYLKRADKTVTLRTRGNDLLIVTVNTETGTLLLRGPAVTSFSGEVKIDD